ncbi:hypothetical protein SNEBB_008610 [Seison nebaliae]|nr:hypothetical protein SNEBB_008610 [Seison nebaliae]
MEMNVDNCNLIEWMKLFFDPEIIERKGNNLLNCDSALSLLNEIFKIIVLNDTSYNEAKLRYGSHRSSNYSAKELDDSFFVPISGWMNDGKCCNKDTVRSLMKYLNENWNEINGNFKKFNLFNDLIENLFFYYEKCLQQKIVNIQIDFRLILETNDTSSSIDQLLLFLLGIAVQCENRECFINDIQQLPLHVQRTVANCIMKITNESINTISIDYIKINNNNESLELFINNFNILHKNFYKELKKNYEKDFIISTLFKYIQLLHKIYQINECDTKKFFGSDDDLQSTYRTTHRERQKQKCVVKKNELKFRRSMSVSSALLASTDNSSVYLEGSTFDNRKVRKGINSIGITKRRESIIMNDEEDVVDIESDKDETIRGLEWKLDLLKEELNETVDYSEKTANELQKSKGEISSLRQELENAKVEAKTKQLWKDEADILRERHEEIDRLKKEINEAKRLVDDYNFLYERLETMTNEKELMEKQMRQLEKSNETMRIKLRNYAQLEYELIYTQQHVSDLRSLYDDNQSKMLHLYEHSEKLKLSLEKKENKPSTMSSPEISIVDDSIPIKIQENSQSNSIVISSIDPINNNNSIQTSNETLTNNDTISNEDDDNFNCSQSHENQDNILEDDREVDEEEKQFLHKIKRTNLQLTSSVQTLSQQLKQDRNLKMNLLKVIKEKIELREQMDEMQEKNDELERTLLKCELEKEEMVKKWKRSSSNSQTKLSSTNSTIEEKEDYLQIISLMDEKYTKQLGAIDKERSVNKKLTDKLLNVQNERQLLENRLKETELCLSSQNEQLIDLQLLNGEYELIVNKLKNFVEEKDERNDRLKENIENINEFIRKIKDFILSLYSNEKELVMRIMDNHLIDEVEKLKEISLYQTKSINQTTQTTLNTLNNNLYNSNLNNFRRSYSLCSLKELHLSNDIDILTNSSCSFKQTYQLNDLLIKRLIDQNEKLLKNCSVMNLKDFEFVEKQLVLLQKHRTLLAETSDKDKSNEHHYYYHHHYLNNDENGRSKYSSLERMIDDNDSAKKRTSLTKFIKRKMEKFKSSSLNHRTTMFDLHNNKNQTTFKLNDKEDGNDMIKSKKNENCQLEKIRYLNSDISNSPRFLKYNEGFRSYKEKNWLRLDERQKRVKAKKCQDPTFLKRRQSLGAMNELLNEEIMKNPKESSGRENELRENETIKESSRSCIDIFQSSNRPDNNGNRSSTSISTISSGSTNISLVNNKNENKQINRNSGNIDKLSSSTSRSSVTSNNSSFNSQIVNPECNGTNRQPLIRSHNLLPINEKLELKNRKENEIPIKSDDDCSIGENESLVSETQNDMSNLDEIKTKLYGKQVIDMSKRIIHPSKSQMTPLNAPLAKFDSNTNKKINHSFTYFQQQQQQLHHHRNIPYRYQNSFTNGKLHLNNSSYETPNRHFVHHPNTLVNEKSLMNTSPLRQKRQQCRHSLHNSTSSDDRKVYRRQLNIQSSDFPKSEYQHKYQIKIDEGQDNSQSSHLSARKKTSSETAKSLWYEFGCV